MNFPGRKPSLQFIISAVESLEKRQYAPDGNLYASLIRNCGDCKALSQGRRVHSHLTNQGFGSDRFLGNLLVQMYGKCGSLEEAHTTFRTMPHRNRFTWAILMSAYAQNGHSWEVIDLFHEMDLEGIRPDCVNFVSLLNACSHAGALSEGRLIHSRVSLLGLVGDEYMSCALVTMYGRCGLASEAKSIFDSAARGDVVTWNAMLAAYAQNGHYTEAMSLFRDYTRSGVSPDNVTYITVLYACACLEDLDEGARIHSSLDPKQILDDPVLSNALLTMYYKCQRVEVAEEIFERMLNRTDATWNVVVSANAQSGQPRNAIHLYRRMSHEGFRPGEITFMSVLDACCLLKDLEEGKRVHSWMTEMGIDREVIIGTNLVNMYGKCGSVLEARRVFDTLKRKTLITWTAMIAAYAQNGESREALDTFYRMEGIQEECHLDNIVLITIIDACTRVGDLQEGRRVHERVKHYGLEMDLLVSNSLITMYNKCGSLSGSKAIFDKIKNPNIVSWNAMLAAYCEHGLNQEVVDFYGKMVNLGELPDDVTFVSLLFACSHAGLFEHGLLQFLCMKGDYGVECRFEHYICVADLLGRAGRLDDAEELLDKVPIRDAASAWNTLLSACKMHSNVEKGERVAEKIFELDPQAAPSYVLLSSMYSAVGRFADAARVRRRMEENCGMTSFKLKSFD